MIGFDPRWRELVLGDLDDTFDLVVIGGGITGCGVLLDAAQRGLRTLLVEKGDLASGTSSRSSKLVHGGLRYLRQMQFRITRHACHERDRMTALNPHLVDPISFLYPAYEGDETPGWQIDLGLWMYDRLTRADHRHRHPTGEEMASLAPGLEVDDLDRAMLYGDSRTDDARLTWAVAATGWAYGGRVLTRALVEEGTRDPSGRLVGVVVRDLETDATHRIEARVVLNATGHWTDEVRGRFGLEGRRVRPSRGVHLVFPVDRLPVSAALALASPDDGRLTFVIPHPEGVLVGTTDHYHEGSLDDPRATREEVDYLIRVVQHAFPSRDLGEADVRGVFAGLRPILDSHTERPSDASREEEIWEERGLLNIAGGKLTTYRLMAEDAVDEVLRLLPEEVADSTTQCATEGTPLVGLAPTDLAERLVATSDVDATVAFGMARRLGSTAWAALGMAKRHQELDPIVAGLDLSAAEVRAHLRFGAVLHLEDLLLRRVRLGMWRPDAARDLAPRLRSLFADELGWRGPRWSEEEERFERAASAWTLGGVT